MSHFVVDTERSSLVVMARSKVHDTKLTWRGIAGTIDADLDNLAKVHSNISVNMSTGDAGDWVKNRKLRKELDFDKNPSATFSLQSIDNLDRDGSAVSATLLGTLTWRGHDVALEVQTKGTLTDSELEVTGQFDIDMTQLGITPPKVLMIKIEAVVNCTIAIRASASKA